MRTIYLHIGMHKTGSSSIQNNLIKFDNGVTKYANLEYENHSIPFYTVFSGNHQDYHIWREAGLTEQQKERKRQECLARIVQSLQEDIGRDIIFSGEGISLIPEHGIIKIKDFLERWSDKIVVIAYVRDPLGFMASALQEKIKSGTHQDTPPVPNYRKRFEKFITIFGRENIIFRPFQRELLYQHNIVSDFCKMVNIEAPEKISMINESLSTEAIKAIYLLNKIISPLDGIQRQNLARQQVASLLNRVFPGKFSVPQDILSPYVDNDDIRWLNQNAGFDFECSGKADQKEQGCQLLKEFLENLEEQSIDRLLELLRAARFKTDFDRSPLRIVHQIFLAFLVKNAPVENFSASRYLDLNPDLKVAGVNPYEHFLKFGIRERRKF